MIGILRETIVTARRVFGVREPTESVADIVMIAWSSMKEPVATEFARLLVAARKGSDN